MDLPAQARASGDCRPADARITEQAAGRLGGGRYKVLRAVSCVSRAGVLTLHGRLPTYYLKQIAQEAVAGIPGVRRVENHIEVLPPPAWAPPSGTEGPGTAPVPAE